MISDTMKSMMDVLLSERKVSEEESLVLQLHEEKMSDLEKALSCPKPDMQALPALIQAVFFLFFFLFFFVFFCFFLFCFVFFVFLFLFVCLFVFCLFLFLFFIFCFCFYFAFILFSSFIHPIFSFPPLPLFPSFPHTKKHRD